MTATDLLSERRTTPATRSLDLAAASPAASPATSPAALSDRGGDTALAPGYDTSAVAPGARTPPVLPAGDICAMAGGDSCAVAGDGGSSAAGSSAGEVSPSVHGDTNPVMARDERAAVLELRPAPALEPPYDDEQPAESGGRAVEGFGSRSAAVPSGAAPPRDIELPFGAPSLAGSHVMHGGHVSGDPVGAGGHPRIVPLRYLTGEAAVTRHLPAAKTYSERVVRAVVEVIARRRPLQQLMPLVTADVYEQLGNLQRWAMREARAGRPMLIRLRSVRASQPAASVAEVSAVIAVGGRSYAAVLRLEIIDGRWLCTLLHLL